MIYFIGFRWWRGVRWRSSRHDARRRCAQGKWCRSVILITVH